MNRQSWKGVIPAITTPFTKSLALDTAFLSKHVRMLADAGSVGIVAPGSLGEGSTLSLQEKETLWKVCASTLGDTPMIAAIAAASTADAAMLARMAQDSGCKGLMVLPPYLYKGSWRETRAHFSAVLNATNLSCMLYNNPIAYGTDVTPAQITELAASHSNLHAVKESSGDVRRITAIRELLGDRLALFVGMDDLIVEGVAAGAVGWIAGVVNALPRESMVLFELARSGRSEKLDALYHWMLPLLRMDTTYDFVQLIKLMQQECGVVGEGGAITRPPRLMPHGQELDAALSVIRHALKTSPPL